jgi:hypothetical protein
MEVCHDVDTENIAATTSVSSHLSLRIPTSPLALSSVKATTRLEYPVVPEENPSQIIHDPSDDVSKDVDCDESDGGDDGSDDLLIEDGIGDDDEEDEDDEDEVGDIDSSRKGLPVRPLPAWLKDAFNQRVEESKLRGQDGLPALYRDHKTFWFPRPSTFFLLKDKSISPQQIYSYDMFLWDPMVLVNGGIPCPNVGCHTLLWRHGHAPRPRRVVDLNRTFWIIGYRYCCPNCKPPKSVTFRSWDQRILDMLPGSLSAEFPARLSYRSGLSTNALALMRSCFQNGMGAKQFSNTLLVQHLQSYDQLHLSYLQTLALYALSPNSQLNKQRFKPFLPFHDRSSDGFQGFVPSAQWLRDIYDMFVEKHQQELNQHTSMLTGSICAIDHSFKVCQTCYVLILLLILA